jgi:thiamine-monophosphate kinase
MGMSESEIIALVREMACGPTAGVRVPIGDDAALFEFVGGSVLLTVDSVYEGVHFTLDAFGYSDVGWKAVAAGVSDIAAMGGEPSCLLLSLGFGSAPEPADVRSLLEGVIEMASSCNCALIGGDVCRSGAGLALTVTVAGTPPPSGVVLRSGARPGDLIGVTGGLGGSGAGLFVLEQGGDDLRSRFPGLVEAHLRPRPRVLAGGLLAAAGATAMEDVSDGLGPDLNHICDESGVGCEVESALVPVNEQVLTLASECGVDPLEWALGGGEDYELLFTAHPGHFDTAVNALALHGIPAARLGTVTEMERGRILVTGRGREELGGESFEHF